jgi:UDP-glucuronate decarboxylase
LTSKIIELTGSKSKLFITLPSDDPMQRQPDISLAQKELDWSPKVNLDEGLNKNNKIFEKIS